MVSISLERGQSSIFPVIKTVGDRKEKVSEGQRALVPHFVKMNVAHHGYDNHKKLRNMAPYSSEKCSTHNKVEYERFKNVICEYGLGSI